MEWRLCIAAALALLALGCSAGPAGVAFCETAFETCRAEAPAKTGAACVCQSKYWAHPGVVR